MGESTSSEGSVSEPSSGRHTAVQQVSRDRQVLVVGRNLATRTTAGFLDQAGISPVVARGHGDVPAPSTVPLWRPGLELLGRVGIRRPVEHVGSSVDALRCATPAASWSTTPGRRPSLVTVPRGRVRSLVDQHFGNRIRSLDRTVASVTSHPAGVEVTFDHGVREVFDVVVTADPTLLPGGQALGRSTQVRWWAFDWPAPVPAPDDATEAWDGATAAFTRPLDDSVRVVLVAGSGVRPENPLARGCLRALFADKVSGLEDAIAALDISTLQYREFPFAIPARRACENVALVGPGAHASIPGDCLGPTLTVEDAWVLADELAYGPEAVEEALSAYVERRRRRMAAINSTMATDAYVARAGGNVSGVTRQLCSRRALAFGHVLDVNTRRFVHDIPGQL
jgi:2-polyprenyl-6-methoxyphenol hydroxylase-like FAD-dependent oxidoreductase